AVARQLRDLVLEVLPLRVAHEPSPRQPDPDQDPDHERDEDRDQRRDVVPEVEHRRSLAEARAREEPRPYRPRALARPRRSESITLRSAGDARIATTIATAPTSANATSGARPMRGFT